MVTKENAGFVLLKHRNDNSFTQEQVSKKSGVSVQTISELESGKVKPQAMTIYKLNKYFEKNGN